MAYASPRGSRRAGGAAPRAGGGGGSGSGGGAIGGGGRDRAPAAPAPIELRLYASNNFPLKGCAGSGFAFRQGAGPWRLESPGSRLGAPCHASRARRLVPRPCPAPHAPRRRCPAMQAKRPACPGDFHCLLLHNKARVLQVGGGACQA
jgi:hypothetical protein